LVLLRRNKGGENVARSITIAIAASVLWLAACAAQAAGLGRLTVLSPLGQPLLAEVEIVSLQAGEEEGLSARLASPEAFSAAGIDLNPALHGLRINLVRRDNRPVLRLTTTQPVNDPFLDLLVELQWPSGRLVREYTFLLDPPDYRNRTAIAAAPSPAPAAQPQPAPHPAPQSQVAPQAEPAPPPQAAAPAAPPAPAEEKAAGSEAKPAESEAKPAGEEKPAGSEEKAAAAEAKPAPAIEQQAIPAEQAKEPAKEEGAKAEAAKAEPAKPATHEVKKGDTLGAIARANLQPGVTLNQMLIAIFRANQDAFIRGNVNLVRTGKILNIPSAEEIGSVDVEEANRLVKEHQAQFMEYRSRLAAAPARVEGGPEREAAGAIEPKPEAPPPASSEDQVRLSKAEPAKPGAPGSRAAQADDAAARERALQEAQSRSTELEKNVADLQKLLDLKNQQLAELEKKAAAKPPAGAPQAQAPAPAKPAPSAAQKPVAPPTASAPAAAPPQPAAKPATPGAPSAPMQQAQAPAAQAPATASPPAAKPPAEKKAAPPAKAKAKAAPPPEPSLFDEFLDNPLYLAALAAVIVLLVFYALWQWRKKKAAHAKFQDSVLGAAAAGGGAAALHEPTANPATAATVSQAAVSQAPTGMEAEEVDPIAEADVYMAYGRDAQAEEILKEALQKDSSRVAVHGKLLEIYANRKDAKAFEQTALKLKNLTGGAGPEWEKAAALGRSIDAGNSVYGAGTGAPVAAPPAEPSAPAAAAAPMLDFDLGGASQGGPAAPDISFDEPPKESTSTSLDLELGSTQTLKLDTKAPDKTVASSEPAEPSIGGLDFNLDLGAGEEKNAEPAAAPAAKAAEDANAGLDFNLDLDDKKADASAPAAPATAAVDLGAISLDLGAPSDETVVASSGSSDPKWQEVATKLDLAKAYEEMGDKDGARELLNEVMKDGDTAQKGQAQQILAKLG
jgi:pilus assembly protein FimV